MINFFKQLLGFGNSQETVKEIVTPPVVTESKPADNVTLQAAYIPPAKPVVNKVKALGETGADAVKAAQAPKPANKQRKPYKGNKPKGVKNAGGTVAKVNQPKPQAQQAKPKAKKSK